MDCYVLDFQEIDQSLVEVVGGKGALLGELSRIEGISVPAGFCVTTDAFRRILAEVPSIDDWLERLANLEVEDRETIRVLSGEIRRALEAVAIPSDLVVAITGSLARLGEQAAYAVRSSATAEDSPTASFAGQQDTHLNIVGGAAVLQHISRCWASLFSERAVTYRLRNGFDQRRVEMAVVVQQMAIAQASGILFTADPVSSNRKVACIEASFGLGEALVSGLVNADAYKVRNEEVFAKTVASKRLAIQPLPTGGTERQAIEPARQEQPALTDAEILQLARLGQRIEAHFDHPQDIEWCLADRGFQIVQSRPITTLFPIPSVSDQENHVYVSVGHQQMMTDAMKPLGLSLWQLTTPRRMAEAGGRLFVDVAKDLASPASREGRLEALATSDPLIGDALRSILERGDFIRTLPDDGAGDAPGRDVLGRRAPASIEPDPAIVSELIERTESSIANLKRDIQAQAGPALLDFILADIQELKRVLFDPRSLQVIVAAMRAVSRLNERLEAWLGEKKAADALTQSLPNNVTSEMGLALLDVADVIRPHQDVVAFLQNVEDEGFLEELPMLPGGVEARDAIQAYLDKYGMRCVGEIDITRPRWSERPTTLLTMILSNIENFERGEGERRLRRGQQEVSKKEQELLARLRTLPDGEQKAEEAKRTIDQIRAFAGYREYPKYGMVSRYFVYKQALLKEAERLLQAHVLGEKEDIFFLTLEELQDVLCANQVDDELIAERKDEFRSYQALTPPRVFTSDGEVIAGDYRREDAPSGALVGLPVSAGTVEGRARVVFDITKADLQAGDILVTPYTDPSWTPLFVTIAGLVTEVGGLMTHGAVIAREYGLPAIVGVEHATESIEDGQRIRLHGTEGYVEVLS